MDNCIRDSEESSPKRQRLDELIDEDSESKNASVSSGMIIANDSQRVDPNNGKEARLTVLLDICCGTGTIGQCILKEFKKNNKVFCVGIDVIEAAIADARENAKGNGLGDDV
ncbi:hypothetical protein TELCIR_03330 [Teladorsagia circumcincta]|uniref:Methyltransferase domain-containing protein n=1 Tax=Teladorsagia circumcincta TaxID=45464 RepID=A0A2G9UWL9_TELCI|nr:hypothetical protein TELCIR_03330 [Teladorsagia circumcincta]